MESSLVQAPSVLGRRPGATSVVDAEGFVGRVLVTGHRGLPGQHVATLLRAAGWDVVGLDLVDGDDVTDAKLVETLVEGCGAIVHLAETDIDDSESGESDDAAAIKATNVGGTQNVLDAAHRAGVERVIVLSSVDVFGCFLGGRPPSYFPIDDTHPLDPDGPYAESKVAVEDLCEAFTSTTGVTTVCLRVPALLDPGRRHAVHAARHTNPASEWSPVCEYGAFLDVADFAAAVAAALTAPMNGHHRLLVCADDIGSDSDDDSLTLAARLRPDVPVVDVARYARRPFAALVDSTEAQRVMRWTPRHPWRTIATPTNDSSEGSAAGSSGLIRALIAR